MEEPIAISRNSVCLVCLSSNDEKKIDLYILQNELLKTIFQMDKLSVCFVCKRLAQHAEFFVQTVQNNQILLENIEATNSLQLTPSQLASIKTQPCPISLTYQQLQPVSLTPEDSNEDCYTVMSSGRQRSNEAVKVKVEMKEEMGYSDFGGDDFDPYIKEEDDFPLKLLKEELKLEGINIKIKKSKKKIKMRFKSKKEEKCSITENNVPVAMNLDSHIETIVRTRSEIIKEREEMCKDEKYINSLFKCQFCLRGFTFKGSYDMHMEKHSESKGAFECEFCKLRMETLEKLEQHKRYHRVRYKCSDCPKTCVQRGTARDHYTAVHCNDAYQFICPHCAKNFKRQASLRKHILQVHNKKRVVCDYCNKSYCGKHGLKNHLILKHPAEVSATNRPRKFVCNECGKAFLSRSHLTTHSLKHSSKRDFYCVECDKSFKSHNMLKQHLKNAMPHVNYLELPIPCDHCERRFSCRRDMHTHANRVHYNVRPYQCDLCEKAYIRQDSLSIHKKRTHDPSYTQPRKFPCPSCDKIFHRRSILKGHIRTHTGERPYQCPQCPARFNQSGVLGTHLKLIHLKVTRDGRPKNNALSVE